MKITLDWLAEHLDGDFTLDDVTATLNRIGHEVEGVEDPADRLKGFRIARVLTAERHPQADKLQVLSVDTGDGTPLQVVCGAPNARAGLVGVLGLPGAIVPANGMELKISAIRGVESNGMMCSTRELELGEEHDGIIELTFDAPNDAPIGMAFADYASVGDAVIDISITPNRQDCMGVRGIARDLAVAGLGALKPLRDVIASKISARPELVEGLSLLAAVDEKSSPSTSSGRAGLGDAFGSAPAAITIRTDDPSGCPAFYGRTIHGVTNGASPDWMQRRLKAVGQRPISALVDITNYVMLDLGRPSHAYDLAQLHGAVVARRAVEGETVTALNGKSYTLSDSMTVIADDHGVHDIAGIMGGEHSGCSETTTEILLEVAYFTPERIALTGQALGLTSDARSRFERGVDPAFLDDATAIITALILEYCGGTASEVTRAGGPLRQVSEPIPYDPSLVLGRGGMDVAVERQVEILESLGFSLTRHSREGGNPSPDGAASPDQGMDSRLRGNDDLWTVTAPTWRRDIDGPDDLVEEVMRIIGFDAIDSTPLPREPGVAKPTATAEQLIERRVRRAAAAAGFHEAVTWSFISEAEAARVGGGTWTLANPISEDMKVMRPSLLPGLLSAAGRNGNRGTKSVRLFELGRRYFSDAERPTIAVVMAGEKGDRAWGTGKATRFDAFDGKAAALTLLEAAGAPVDRLMVMPVEGQDGIWHPGQSGTLRLGPKIILAEFGALHPSLTKGFDVDGTVIAAQIFLDALPAKRSTSPVRDAFTPPALQAVTRDFAFLVPETLVAGDLVRNVRGADKGSITAARLFDRFEKDGQISLAVEVTLQPGDKSFTDVDLKAISDQIVAAAAKLGAVLRT
jgi:phenylalanyl-tRNA synthetase beta chain